MNGPKAARLPLVHQPHALVDVEDLDRVVAAGPWHYGFWQGKAYAQRYITRPDGRGGAERLHTFLTGWPLVDHINGDSLDNRRANLRPATPSQNNANSRRSRRSVSGFKGVSWHSGASRWRAHIGVNGKQKHLGYFGTAEAAARAYDAAAREIYGEYARPNFPNAEEQQ